MNDYTDYDNYIVGERPAIAVLDRIAIPAPAAHINVERLSTMNGEIGFDYEDEGA